MPDFILKHVFTMFSQILARVHGVRFLQMMVHGAVETKVITAGLLALVDRVVLVHVRVPERGLVLHPFGLHDQLFLILVHQPLQIGCIMSSFLIRVHIQFMIVIQVISYVALAVQDFGTANPAFVQHFISECNLHVNSLKLFQRHGMRFLEMVNIRFILSRVGTHTAGKGGIVTRFIGIPIQGYILCSTNFPPPPTPPTPELNFPPTNTHTAEFLVSIPERRVFKGFYPFTFPTLLKTYPYTPSQPLTAILFRIIYTPVPNT